MRRGHHLHGLALFVNPSQTAVKPCEASFHEVPWQRPSGALRLELDIRAQHEHRSTRRVTNRVLISYQSPRLSDTGPRGAPFTLLLNGENRDQSATEPI